MRRSGWLAVVVVAALTGAALADRLAPADVSLPAPDRATHPGGVWACPFLKAAGSAAFLHLVNVGRTPSHVRVTYVTDNRRPVVQGVAVAPRRAGTIAPPPSVKGAAGAIVEFAGGDLVVSRTSFFAANGGAGGAAAACSKPGTQTLVAAQGRTLGADTQLFILNPSSADAVVDVSLLFDGQQIQPETLRRRVVPARGRLVVRVGDFAFDEPAVAALVNARSGRVVADAVLTAPGVIELVPAGPLARELVAIGDSSRGQVAFTTVAVGDVNAVAEGRTLSAAGQGAYEQLATGLNPNAPLVAAPSADAGPPGAVALAVSSSTAPIALGARWTVQATNGRVETGAMVGVPPARRMVGVIGPPGIAAGFRLLLANPDAEDADVEVTILTEAGPVGAPAVHKVPAGHAAIVPLTGISASATVAVVITSLGARVAAVLEGVSSRPVFSVYAVGAGPQGDAPLVAVDPDPRAGVPA